MSRNDDMETGAARVLESIWHEQIPLAAAMQLKVADDSGESLITAAPLEPNINLHGTAFAGSLYSICALTGWGYVWRLAHRSGFAGEIVVSRGEIEYLRPVAETIECRALAAGTEQEAFVEALQSGRPGRCRVACTIEVNGRPAVRYSGNYHMRRPHCVPAPA